MVKKTQKVYKSVYVSKTKSPADKVAAILQQGGVSSANVGLYGDVFGFGKAIAYKDKRYHVFVSEKQVAKARKVLRAWKEMRAKPKKTGRVSVGAYTRKKTVAAHTRKRSSKKNKR